MVGPVFTLIWARGPGPFPSFSFSRIPSPHSNSKAREASIKKVGGGQLGGAAVVKHPLLFSLPLPVSRVPIPGGPPSSPPAAAYPLAAPTGSCSGVSEALLPSS